MKVIDPQLPFVILHNAFTLKPRSFVRMPVRFIPTHCQSYACELKAVVVDGKGNRTITAILRGSSVV